MVKKPILPAHQALLNSLPSKIARIYNSDELDNDLKHDIACRLIAKSIGANSTSLLIYKGSKDHLFCAGKYIDPNFSEAVSVNGEPSDEYLRIMRRIDVLEFLKIKVIQVQVKDLNQQLFDDLYRQYEEYEFSNPIKLPKKEFISFLKVLANKTLSRQILKYYTDYRSNIRNDIHKISLKEPITGAYYYALTRTSSNKELCDKISRFQIKIDNDSIVIADLNNYANTVCKDNLFKKQGISINTDALYIGIPLLANNRPIGILRILLRRNVTFQVPSENEDGLPLDVFYPFESEEDALHYVKDKVSIESISLLLSMLIENLFYVDGMRDISLNDSLKADINNLPLIANELVKIINCYGCVIRLSDSNSLHPSIKGYSSRLENYVQKLNKDDDPYIREDKFVQVLIDLLYSNRKDKRSIECLKVDFSDNGEPIFTLLYLDEKYRLATNHDLKSFLNIKQRKELDQIFRKRAKVWQQYDFHSIILIPIRDQEYGFVSFANTANRLFINKDIEMLIPVITRLGLALKYDSSISKARLASVEEIQKTQRVIYHQLLSPLVTMTTSFKHVRALINKKEYSSLDLRIEEIIDTLKTTKDFVTLNQYLAIFLANPTIVKRMTKVIPFNFMMEKVRSYQVHARVHRGVNLHLVDSDRNKVTPAFLADVDLLSHVIHALLDNAIKYSYNHTLHSIYTNTRNPVFAPENTPKSIYVETNYVNNEVVISVENWGAKIKESDKKQILEYMKRGDHSGEFEENGSGIGLFLANIITQALGGELCIEAENDRTKISLKFKPI